MPTKEEDSKVRHKQAQKSGAAAKDVKTIYAVARVVRIVVYKTEVETRSAKKALKAAANIDYPGEWDYVDYIDEWESDAGYGQDVVRAVQSFKMLADVRAPSAMLNSLFARADKLSKLGQKALNKLKAKRSVN